MAEDTAAFHDALKGACDTYRPDAYAEYKAWCDRYFYLPHRQEPRGVGGIFFDDLASGAVEKDFAFVKAVGEAFLGVYPRIVALRKDTPFDDEAREKLLVKRGTLCRIQSRLRPGHEVRVQHGCGSGSLSDEPAASCKVVN